MSKRYLCHNLNLSHPEALEKELEQMRLGVPTVHMDVFLVEEKDMDHYLEHSCMQAGPVVQENWRSVLETADILYADAKPGEPHSAMIKALETAMEIER